MEYGCIGQNLSHSFSVEIHNKIGDYHYTLVELDTDELPSFFRKKDFKGINVTIPYKSEVMRYIDYISDTAEKIGAVNTVINKNGKLYGYNTDFDGMTALLRHNNIDLKDKTVAVLGSGGTSKTACCVCEYLGAARIIKVSRTPDINHISYKSLSYLKNEIQIIINTTPCGMFPDIDAKPINVADFCSVEAVVDVIYNPLNTTLVSEAEALSKKSCGGLYMLVSQAIYAAGLFSDVKFSDEFSDRIYSEILKSKRNIVLIGMPTSGKSTVGKIVSDKLSRNFYDTDLMIENSCGCSVKDLFFEYGERRFRKLEADAVKSVSGHTGCVIATGGGVVLDSSNIFELKKNGRIYFIDRPLESLKADVSRPLLQNENDLSRLYKERYSLYLKYADCVLDGSQSIETIIKSVTEDADEYSCY